MASEHPLLFSIHKADGPRGPLGLRSHTWNLVMSSNGTPAAAVVGIDSNASAARVAGEILANIMVAINESKAGRADALAEALRAAGGVTRKPS